MPEINDVPAIPHTMKRDRIVDGLRRRILSGELVRGARMPQHELARQFDASITPVREALRILEAEGLLVSEPHRGVRVAGVDLNKVKAAYVTRRLVESYAMRRALTRLDPPDLVRIRALLDEMRTESAQGDIDAFRLSNRRFHFYFYDRCGLPGLTEQIDTMWHAFPWDLMLSTPERIRKSHHEHELIMRAVESGDVDAVAAATEAHIAKVYAEIARKLNPHHTPQADPFQLDVD